MDCHCSVSQSCLTLYNPMDCSTSGLPVLHHVPELLKFTFIESVTPSNHLILWCPLLLLPSIFPSIRVFSNESALRVRCPKYWSFSFSIISSKEHPGLIFFRMDWLDPLAVQGILKSLLQHHSSKASILRCSAFLIVQFSHPYMTLGKSVVLTIWTFISKVVSLFLNICLSFLCINQFAQVLESHTWINISDWFDFLAVQGTLKSLLQHHSSKASILRRWAYFTV